MFVAHELGKTLEEAMAMPPDVLFQWLAYFQELKRVQKRVDVRTRNNQR